MCLNGSNPRKVSTIMGDYVHNYGGIYLPSEKIVFSSTAPMIGVPCVGGSAHVTNMYRLETKQNISEAGEGKCLRESSRFPPSA